MHTERYGCGIIIEKGKQNGLPQNQRNPPLKPTAESRRGKTGHYH